MSTEETPQHAVVCRFSGGGNRPGGVRLRERPDESSDFQAVILRDLDSVWRHEQRGSWCLVSHQAPGSTRGWMRGEHLQWRIPGAARVTSLLSSSVFYAQPWKLDPRAFCIVARKGEWHEADETRLAEGGGRMPSESLRGSHCSYFALDVGKLHSHCTQEQYPANLHRFCSAQKHHVTLGYLWDEGPEAREDVRLQLVEVLKKWTGYRLNLIERTDEGREADILRMRVAVLAYKYEKDPRDPGGPDRRVPTESLVPERLTFRPWFTVTNDWIRERYTMGLLEPIRYIASGDLQLHIAEGIRLKDRDQRRLRQAVARARAVDAEPVALAIPLRCCKPHLGGFGRSLELKDVLHFLQDSLQHCALSVARVDAEGSVSRPVLHGEAMWHITIASTEYEEIDITTSTVP